MLMASRNSRALTDAATFAPGPIGRGGGLSLQAGFGCCGTVRNFPPDYRCVGTRRRVIDTKGKHAGSFTFLLLRIVPDRPGQGRAQASVIHRMRTDTAQWVF